MRLRAGVADASGVLERDRRTRDPGRLGSGGSADRTVSRPSALGRWLGGAQVGRGVRQAREAASANERKEDVELTVASLRRSLPHPLPASQLLHGPPRLLPRNNPLQVRLLFPPPKPLPFPPSLLTFLLLPQPLHLETPRLRPAPPFFLSFHALHIPPFPLQPLQALLVLLSSVRIVAKKRRVRTRPRRGEGRRRAGG